MEIFVESHEVDVHAVEHELNRHQHRDDVPPGEQPKHTDEEQQCTEHENMVEGDLHIRHLRFLYCVSWQ